VTDAADHTYQALRPYLFTVAYRFTGSASDAEDLVHDAWLRYLAAGSPPVDSLQAYLTTIVSRLSLDHLKSARVRRERYVGPWLPEPTLTTDATSDPAAIAEQSAAVSMALLVLLDRLTPVQRVVYVLRESLDLPFEVIGAHLGRSPATCRQHFRRASQRLAGSPAPEHHRVSPGLTDHFLRALERADAAALTRLLSEDVLWISDGGPERSAARNPIGGNDRVARGLAGIIARFGDIHQRFTVECLNGEPGIIIWRGQAITTVVQWQTRDDHITDLWFSRNPAKLAYLARQLGAAIAD
jgi:RNA polymerase sigma-70 factor (ECF subfamily)